MVLMLPIEIWNEVGGWLRADICMRLYMTCHLFDLGRTMHAQQFEAYRAELPRCRLRLAINSAKMQWVWYFEQYIPKVYALKYAIEAGNMLLVQHYWRPWSHQLVELPYHAVRSKSKDMLDFILKYYAEHPIAALLAGAISISDVAMVRELIPAYAQAHGNLFAILDLTDSCDNAEIFKLVAAVINPHYCFALLSVFKPAIEKHTHELIEYAINLNLINVNDALYIAASHARMDLVQYYIDHGADSWVALAEGAVDSNDEKMVSYAMDPLTIRNYFRATYATSGDHLRLHILGPQTAVDWIYAAYSALGNKDINKFKACMEKYYGLSKILEISASDRIISFAISAFTDIPDIIFEYIQSTTAHGFMDAYIDIYALLALIKRRITSWDKLIESAIKRKNIVVVEMIVEYLSRPECADEQSKYAKDIAKGRQYIGSFNDNIKDYTYALS